ncbi:cytochrome c oxidase subunit 3 family protein [bacterium]|nr:cytochrome c oxidase subunit 3 family protein [bacterium]
MERRPRLSATNQTVQDHGQHHHHKDLAHHFDTLEQQHDANTLGMWAFLLTEVLFFGGLFAAYTIYRYKYSAMFEEASNHLDITLGATNTVILILSSLTMALAVRCSQTGQAVWTGRWLLITIFFGLMFLGVKYFEWKHDYNIRLMPGKDWAGKDFFWWQYAKKAKEMEKHDKGHSHALPDPKDVLPDNHPSLGVKGIQESQQARLFFLLYFCMTSLHALHMLVGFVLIGIIAYFAYQGAYSPDYYSPVENIGLYWHFVDIVWIFLFPLLYLLGAHMGH